MYMNLKKRILVCIILLLFLAVMCMIGVFSQRSIQAMGNAIQEADSKKIALTFDDDVIIGLSQEISYKEAVSMI